MAWRRAASAMEQAFFRRRPLHASSPWECGTGFSSLWSKLHCVRYDSSLTIQLRPGIDEKSILKESFVNVIKGDTKAQMEHIGYSITGRIKVEMPIVIEPQDAFAVVQIGAKQFKVTSGDCLYVEKLKHADINDLLSLNKVLLLGTKTDTVVGRPLVPNAAVSAIVEEHALTARTIVFKKKRRKNYRRCKGHRQMLTRIRITRIRGLENYVELPEEDVPITVAQ